MGYDSQTPPSDTRPPLRYVRCRCGMAFSYRWPCWCARCGSPHPAAPRAKAREGGDVNACACGLADARAAAIRAKAGR